MRQYTGVHICFTGGWDFYRVMEQRAPGQSPGQKEEGARDATAILDAEFDCTSECQAQINDELRWRMNSKAMLCSFHFLRKGPYRDGPCLPQTLRVSRLLPLAAFKTPFNLLLPCYISIPRLLRYIHAYPLTRPWRPLAEFCWLPDTCDASRC